MKVEKADYWQIKELAERLILGTTSPVNESLYYAFIFADVRLHWYGLEWGIDGFRQAPKLIWSNNEI